MTTPTVVVIEAVLYQKYLESQLKVSLLPVCLGVVVTTVTDFRLNPVGAAYAVAGVIVTSFYQIWSGTLQKSLDCNALQLQFYVAPLAALFILPFIPIFDNYSPADLDSVWFYEFTPANVGLIAVTGFFGFLVNVSIFLVIGRSSPVSYNVLGHGKTVFVLLSDFLLFGRPFTVQSSSGILLTMLGVVWYTRVKLDRQRVEAAARGRADEKAADLHNVSSNGSDEEREDLLKRDT
jgi:solute carrier family 35, member E3